MRLCVLAVLLERVAEIRAQVIFTSAPRMLTDLHGADIHGSLDRALCRLSPPA